MQFRNIVEDDWEPGNDWSKIKSAGMFYDWLANPIKQILYVNDANAGCGPKARQVPHTLLPCCLVAL